MNFEQLRSFVTVAETGHFTRAAEHLHLAQPSLSRQISTLETDLGSELFHRTRGNISLTSAGETLLPFARRMLADAESVHREMAELAGLSKGRVRLGATPTLCMSLVTEALSAFHDAHPGVDLRIVERGSRGLLDQLANGAIDLAIITVTDERPTAALTRTPLLQEELVVISSAARAPITRAQRLRLDELAELPLIMFDESYDLRAATDTALRAARLVPRVVLEGAEMDAVLRFVERGLGVAVVPAMVLINRPNLRAVRLADPAFTRTVSLAHRADMNLSQAASAMRDVIATTADSLSAADPMMTRL